MNQRKYPFVEIKFSDYCSDEDKIIINKYWEIENGKFKTRPNKLVSELGINNSKLSKIVKSNSESILHVEKCLACPKDIEIEITSLTTAQSLLESKKFICEECNSEQKALRKDQDSFQRKSHRMNYAVNYKYWNRLEKDEFDVLRKIVEFDNYLEFKKKYLNQNFEFAWPIIEKLDNLALIDIRGVGYENRPIKELFFLPELRDALKISSRENTHIESSLNFHIPKRLNRTKETYPNFFKKVIFNQDIILKQGTEYFCSVWENDDGSINLGIKAKSELLDKNAREINDEPKKIANLIAKKWK